MNHAQAASAQITTRLLLGLGFLLMMMSVLLKGGFQVFFTDLALFFGKGRGDLGFVAGVFLLVSGVSSPVVGYLSDKHGPLLTATLGCFVAGVAFTTLGTMPIGYSTFVLVFGVLAALALAAISHVPMGVLVDRTFEDKTKGLAYAIITNGTAIGFIVFSPLLVWLQTQWLWQSVFMAIGLVFLGPMTLLLAYASRSAAFQHTQSLRATSHPKAWQQVAQDPGFYVLSLAFMSCGATMAFIDVHLIPFWKDQAVKPLTMGLALSLLGALELISGLVAGWLARKHSHRWLLAGFYGLRFAALLLLLSNTPWVYTHAFALVFGASYLGTVVITSTLCLLRYGPHIKGQVFGVMFMLHQVAAFACAQLGGIWHDNTQSYQSTLFTLLALTALAVLFSLALKPTAPASLAPMRSL